MRGKEIILAKGKDKALLRKHPWVFSGAIAKENDCAEGDTVRIVSAEGKFLAIGHYMSPNASIRVKILTYHDELIDQTWWNLRIQNALELRKQLGLFNNPDTTAYRLFYGEGDFVPGLIIDIYGNNAVIQCHTLGVYRSLSFIVAALKSLFDYQLETIYDKSGESLHHDSIGSKFLMGSASEADILENGVKFKVNWVEGQKTGFFLDQRDNRNLLKEFSDGKKVLNAFAYSGGFSMYALQAGASKVVSVDLSKSACEMANLNAEINDVSERHEAIDSDVQVYLKNMDRDFDIVILDPPAFAKRRKAVHNAIQAYKRLNATAIKNMQSGSLLFTYSCSQNVSSQMFTDTIRAAAIEVGKSVQILRELRQPSDHPENLNFPEGHYLKGLLLRIQ